MVTYEEAFKLMLSKDFKERMVGEYWYKKTAYTKLHIMLIKHDAGKLDFTPTTPIEKLRKQNATQGNELNLLEQRSLIENVDISEENAHKLAAKSKIIITIPEN